MAYCIESERNVFFINIYQVKMITVLFYQVNSFVTVNYNSRYYTTTCIAIYEFSTMIKPSTKYNIHQAELIEKIAIIDFF